MYNDVTREELLEEIEWLTARLDEDSLLRLWSLANRLYVTQEE